MGWDCLEIGGCLSCSSCKNYFGGSGIFRNRGGGGGRVTQNEGGRGECLNPSANYAVIM